jgi:hypothetical protein
MLNRMDAGRITGALLIGLLLAPTPSFAWGPDGHQAVAAIAANRLTPVTAKEIASLLGGLSMTEASVWADDVRNTTHKHTTAWHFINVPLTSSGYNGSRDCRARNCVVGAIERQSEILRDRRQPRLARQEALKFLIHFVGDIHQPLHAVDAGDRGGNDRDVTPVATALNLHSAWDGGIIQAQRRNAGSLVAGATRWLATQTESTVAGGSPVDWANESHRLANTVVYRQIQGDDTISANEQLEALRVIEQRIAQAGVRLAALLNRLIALPRT